MESAAITFQNGIASLLNCYIFPAIVQGLSSRGVNISAEELSAMTNTPVTKQSMSSLAPINSTPVSFGGPVPAMTQGTNSNGKITHLLAPIPGKTCAYQFKRGQNK